MAATTAASLLGLVSHLQSMESAFTGVLLESALKLSNVTDANIFILVETSEGRQWAGNRHLKEEFLNSGLHPCPGDVECVVDPSKQLIRGKPYPPFPNLDSLFPRPPAKESPHNHVNAANPICSQSSGSSTNEAAPHSRPAEPSMSCRASMSPMAAPTSSGSDASIVTSAAESMQWPRKRASPNSNSIEDGTPAKMQCSSEKLTPTPGASTGSGSVGEASLAASPNMSDLPSNLIPLDSIFEDAVKVKEEQFEQQQTGIDSKNECDSTRNGDILNSDDDSNHRCEVIETKPISLNPGARLQFHHKYEVKDSSYQ